MSLTHLTSADLRQIGQLLEKKEALQAKVAEIDNQLKAFEGSGAQRQASGSVSNGRSGLRAAARPAAAARGRRGALKENIIESLQSAGGKGMHVKDLADSLKTTRGNIRVWFLTTGKKIPQIKKIAPATYRWSA